MDETNPECGTQYCFIIGDDTEWPGDILVFPDVVRWHYSTEPKRSPYSLLNLRAKPHFVVTDSEGKEVLRIQREKRIPATFAVWEQGEEVGRIARRGVFRNKYALEVKDGSKWIFRMPLFSTFFRGESESGQEVLVRMGPKRQWMLLVEKGCDSIPLLGGLAFIHREWWAYS